jgi:Domain of unknown function (DUF4136)
MAEPFIVFRLVAAIALTLFGTLALAQSVTYDYDRAANFSDYKTYAWTRGTELADEFDHASVVRAIDTAFAAKGLAQVESSANPDVLVAYHASFDGNLKTIRSTPGRGPLNVGGRWSSPKVKPVLVGTLVVDVLDARRGALVWQSRASKDIEPSDKPESRDRTIAKATEKMFKNYPPKR